MRIAPLALLLAFGLAACAETPATTTPATTSTLTSVPPIYQARTDVGPNKEPVAISAVNIAYLTERNRRQQVAYNGPEKPGTIVVDPYARLMYFVGEGGQATRYGVAVGKAGTGFEGSATIQRKVAWPSWAPTANMLRTNPELYGPVKGGLKGGIDNPLGSRALYLYKDGRDTYYRIHGTMDPSSIGKATSAGCIRMFNQDIMDVFQSVPMGTPVRVRSLAESRQYEGELVESPEGYLTPIGGAVSYADPSAAAPAAVVGAASVPVESAVPRL